MDSRLQNLIRKIESEKGSFFIARLALRVSFALDDEEDVSDPEAAVRELIEACKELGYTPAE